MGGRRETPIWAGPGNGTLHPAQELVARRIVGRPRASGPTDPGARGCNGGRKRSIRVCGDGVTTSADLSMRPSPDWMLMRSDFGGISRADRRGTAQGLESGDWARYSGRGLGGEPWEVAISRGNLGRILREGLSGWSNHVQLRSGRCETSQEEGRQLEI